MPDPHPGKFFRPSARQIGQQNQTLRKADKVSPFASGPLITPNPCTVFVRNKTGATLSRHSILAITGVEITPDENENSFTSRPVLSGDTPDGTEPVFIILQEPLANNAIGRATAIGPVAVCKVDILDEDHTHAKLIDSDSELESDTSGPGVILYKEAGTGIKWAVLLLGAGESGTCDEVDEFWIEGVPTSGSGNIGYTLDRDPDAAPSAVYDDLAFDYNETAATFLTQLLTHAIGDLTTDDVEVFGGPWPNVSIYVRWKGTDFGKRSIDFPSLDPDTLNNGAVIKMRKASSANWSGY